nr:MAG TPA: hypothetical protein [Caudoviricetes sp.]
MSCEFKLLSIPFIRYLIHLMVVSLNLLSYW